MKRIILMVSIPIGILLIFIYKSYNPMESVLFPKCPFYLITNIKCPGCGSQRAIHYLLNLDVIAALKENALVVIFTPYITLNLSLKYLFINSKRGEYLERVLYGRWAIYAILVVVLLFFIVRIIF